MLPILASLAWLAWGGLTATEAAAHTCVTPVEVIVGQPAAVTVGVAAEGVTPVVGIDITVPDGFAFDAFVPSGGWEGTLEGNVLSLRGGRIAGGACGFLVLKGTATKAGTLRFPMRTTDQDGTVRTLDQTQVFNPLAAMVVQAERPGGSGGSGPNPLLLAGAGLVLLVLAGGVVVVVRRRRDARRRDGGAAADRPVVYPTRPSRRR